MKLILLGLTFAWCALVAHAVVIALGIKSFCPHHSALRRWLRLKRVCAWCRPQRWIGGNPFAGRISHGICPRCREKFLARSHPCPSVSICG